MKHVFLDSHPLSLISTPNLNQEGKLAAAWVDALSAAGHRVYLPEIIDYELRRELIRAGKTASIALLNEYKATLSYLPLTTEAMLLAADLWARMRNSGTPTGDPKKLDIDVILAAQALIRGRTLGVSGPDTVVATSNVAHLSRFVSANLWSSILP